MKGLTPKQLEIFTFIQDFIAEHRYSPSYREIMTHFNLSSPGSVYKHIRTLEKKGALAENKKSHRGIKPAETVSLTKTMEETQIPLIGNLSVGYPLELLIKPQMIAVPRSLIHSPETTYLIQIQGDSLQEEQIRNGDLLLIEAKQDIQPGEVILGVINQKNSVLRRYYPEGHYIRLESQQHPPQSIFVRSEHITIQGTLIGLLRIY